MSFFAHCIFSRFDWMALVSYIIFGRGGLVIRNSLYEKKHSVLGSEHRYFDPNPSHHRVDRGAKILQSSNSSNVLTDLSRFPQRTITQCRQ